MLSVKQGVIKYHFLSLWYNSSWDWTQVSRTIGKKPIRYWYKLLIIELAKPIPSKVLRQIFELVDWFSMCVCVGGSSVVWYFKCRTVVLKWVSSNSSHAIMFASRLIKAWTSLSHSQLCIMAVLLKGWLWHDITHEGWYTIEQRIRNLI